MHMVLHHQDFYINHKVCSKTAMKGRGSPPSRIHHSRRNMLPFAEQVLLHSPTRASHDQGSRALQKSEVRVNTGDIQVSKMNLALGDKGPDIKIEPFAECQSSWKLVDSAKTKAAKEYEDIISLFKDLKAMHQNPGKDMKKLLGDLQDGLNRVGKALDDLRNDLAASKLEISSDMDQAKPLSEVDRLEGKRKSAPRWAESFEKENPGSP